MTRWLAHAFLSVWPLYASSVLQFREAWCVTYVPSEAQQETIRCSSSKAAPMWISIAQCHLRTLIHCQHLLWYSSLSCGILQEQTRFPKPSLGKSRSRTVYWLYSTIFRKFQMAKALTCIQFTEELGTDKLISGWNLVTLFFSKSLCWHSSHLDPYAHIFCQSVSWYTPSNSIP